jgi:hypothetical protein
MKYIIHRRNEKLKRCDAAFFSADTPEEALSKCLRSLGREGYVPVAWSVYDREAPRTSMSLRQEAMRVGRLIVDNKIVHPINPNRVAAKSIVVNIVTPEKVDLDAVRQELIDHVKKAGKLVLRSGPLVSPAGTFISVKDAAMIARDGPAKPAPQATPAAPASTAKPCPFARYRSPDLDAPAVFGSAHLLEDK